MLSNDDFVMESDTNEADRRLVVKFSYQPRLDRTKTEAEGREVFRDVEYVTILIPGDKSLTVHRPILPADRNRFPTQYRAWMNKRGEVLTGTPLAGWPLVTDGQRRELEYFHIRTVEQLAEVADGFAANMMGVQQLKQAAQRYIASAKDKAPAIAMAKELADQDAKITALQEQITALLAVKTEKPEKAPKAKE